LTTLDRQFKNIARGELQVIEETLPSLLTGLKLIWTISRHINQTEARMEDILESISNEICDKVKAQIDIDKIFKKKPEDAIKIIKQGKSVLVKWKRDFDATRRDIEVQQTVKRWDFSKVKEIFEQPLYMGTVLDDLERACVVVQEFFAILGPDLKAVTGSAKQIDEETEKVKEQVKKLVEFNTKSVGGVFSQHSESKWRAAMGEFEAAIGQIDGQVTSLIRKTFSE
jgi:dynein heavy chain